MMCARGDWRRRQGFEFLVRPGETLDSAFQFIAATLGPPLAKLAYMTFSRSRWTGQERALIPIGILTNLHDLAFDAYIDYLEHAHGFKRSASLPVPVVDPGVLASEWSDIGAVDVDGPSADVGNVDFNGDLAEDPRAQASASWAEVNKRNRGSTLRFFESRPGVRLMEIRKYLGPMGSYRNRVIETSGQIMKQCKVLALFETQQVSRAPALCWQGDLGHCWNVRWEIATGKPTRNLLTCTARPDSIRMTTIRKRWLSNIGYSDRYQGSRQ